MSWICGKVRAFRTDDYVAEGLLQPHHLSMACHVDTRDWSDKTNPDDFSCRCCEAFTIRPGYDWSHRIDEADYAPRERLPFTGTSLRHEPRSSNPQLPTPSTIAIRSQLPLRCQYVFSMLSVLSQMLYEDNESRITGTELSCRHQLRPKQ